MKDILRKGKDVKTLSFRVKRSEIEESTHQITTMQEKIVPRSFDSLRSLRMTASFLKFAFQIICA